MSQFLDFESLERSRTPNDYLVAPEGLTAARTDRVAPVFAFPPERLFEEIKTYLESNEGFRDIATDPAQRALKAVAVTRILRFRDDVDAKVLPARGGATLAVYSRSRVGNSDLGANRKRVEGLLDQLGMS